MKLKKCVGVMLVVLSAFALSRAYGHADYIGYSGAPASHGKCAAACHGTAGGTITITGFPTEYVRGQSYPVWVRHSGGGTIVNFNCSVRQTGGNQTAGTLTANLNTAIYAAGATEPMGVHFDTTYLDSGSFTWTADSIGSTGVTLYLAGLQTDHDGLNTVIVASAVPHAGVTAQPDAPQALSLTLGSRIVQDYLVMHVNTPANAHSRIRIMSSTGCRLAAIDVPSSGGPQSLIWKPEDSSGRRLAPGSYFASLTSGNSRQIRKFVIAR